MISRKLVVGVAGMAGSGKSVVVNIAAQNGYEVISMGDEVREEARKRGLKPLPGALGKTMLELRKTEGEAAIARRCLSKIQKAQKDKILVDGIRSLAEVEEFLKHFPNFTLIAVNSAPRTRFRRLFNRQRSDDPKEWQVFHERDIRELGVGLGNAIAMADHAIVNEDDLQDIKAKTHKILRKVEKAWIK